MDKPDKQCEKGKRLRQYVQESRDDDKAYNNAVDNWIRHCKNCRQCDTHIKSTMVISA